MHVAVIGLLQVTLLFCGPLAIAERSKNCAELKLNGDSVSGVKTVYPLEGFDIYSVDVFCDQVTDGGGWTVIHNRDDVPVRENFYRTWSEYAQGFGSLTSEFWLGLENIHALTSSTEMELRVDLEDREGEKRWAKYGSFRVGDSSTKYVLNIGDYSGDAGDAFTPSDSPSVNLNGIKFTTHDQDNDHKPEENCAKIFQGAFWFNDCYRAHLNGIFDTGIIWKPFHKPPYSLKKASMKIRPISTTVEKLIEPMENPPVTVYMSSDAPIAPKLPQTSTSSKKAKHCAEITLNEGSTSGVQTVYTNGDNNPKPVEVYCDQTTDGGGWTIIQNRTPLPVRETFERSWQDYVQGFGDPNGELWLGLENIHAMTSSSPMELRIELEDWEGEKRWAKYSMFNVGDAASKYVLGIGNYSGDAGNGMTPKSNRAGNLNGMQFSARDQDNDRYELNCAKSYRGAWWFNHCHTSHLNGYQYVGKHESSADGISWPLFRGFNYSLKKASMKIRPVNFRKL